jgi:hypothetical protein
MRQDISNEKKQNVLACWIPLQADFTVLRQTSTSKSHVQRLHALENEERGN